MTQIRLNNFVQVIKNMSIQSITVAPKAFRKTLVYYYMPGCPFCKEFEPVFLKIAKACEGFTSFHVAAVDTTKHADVGVPVKTVPTIFYFNIHGQPLKLSADSKEDRSFIRVMAFFFQNLLRDYGGHL